MVPFEKDKRKSKDSDLELVKSYFVRYASLKSTPEVIIFWDVSKPQAVYSWHVYFRQQEFFGSFTDYRLLIGRQNSTTITVNLICIHCGLEGYLGSSLQIFSQLVNTSKAGIEDTWKQIHGNLHKLPFWCDRCLMGWQILRNLEAYLSFKIRGKLNTSMAVSTMPFWGFAGFMTAGGSLEVLPKRILLPFSFPHFSISPFVWLGLKLQMCTVVPNKLLDPIGLVSMAKPFEDGVWYQIVIFLVGAVVILTIACPGDFTGTLLAIWAPLTDHWCYTVRKSGLTAVVFLWSTLCLSLTVLYGGDMVSQATVRNPPTIPVTLAESTRNTISLVDFMIHDDEIVSYLPRVLSTRVKQNENKIEKARRLQLVSLLNTWFCSSMNMNLSLHRPKTPFACNGHKLDVTFDHALTFIGHESQITAVSYAFEHSLNFWVSHSTTLKDYETLSTVLYIRNYFSKLIEPIISAWSTSGLQTYWENYKMRKATPGFYVKRAQMGYRAFNIYENSSVDLAALVNTALVFLVLLTILGITFTVELDLVGRLLHGVHEYFVSRIAKCVE